MEPPLLEAGFVALELTPFGLNFIFFGFIDFLGDGEEGEEELSLSLELELELSSLELELDDPDSESELELDPEDELELELELEPESELRLELSGLLLLFRLAFESVLHVSKHIVKSCRYSVGLT